ncbi:hypothetical protein GC102_31770 [Paenibacillus sp. LMG 31460]|uniref:Uncharacterized protein n=1 Tax=Paenibacillus germinis TaxID=2654979 RepID=A0ABX1ZAA7_9BACL|nr:hypothetical protein [Paenibacillus germinis]NOU90287.1 hypothetical protein [Paenibacillus germinis]
MGSLVMVRGGINSEKHRYQARDYSEPTGKDEKRPYLTPIPPNQPDSLSVRVKNIAKVAHRLIKATLTMKNTLISP